jgi:hypothetical protein
MITEKRRDKIEIDLTGPQGNVFFLIGTARDLGKQLNKLRGADYFDVKAITEDMMSDDYEHAIDVMEEHFGDFIILYR